MGGAVSVSRKLRVEERPSDSRESSSSEYSSRGPSSIGSSSRVTSSQLQLAALPPWQPHKQSAALISTHVPCRTADGRRLALQVALEEARAISRQWEKEAKAAAEAEAARIARARAEDAAQARRAKSKQLRAVAKLHQRAPSPLDAACAERRATSLQPGPDMALVVASDEPEASMASVQSSPAAVEQDEESAVTDAELQQQERTHADFRVLRNTPVLDAMHYGAAEVDKISASQLVSNAAIYGDSSAGEWIRFDPQDPSRTAGWVSVLAPDGWTLQLGRESERADFRVLRDAPVLETMLHGATQVGTVSARELIESASIQVSTRGGEGGEWVYFDPQNPTRTAGWVSVLAPDGWTLQLGRDQFNTLRQAKRKVKKVTLGHSSTSTALAVTRAKAEEKEFVRKRDEARAAGMDEPLAEGAVTCMLMTGDARIFKRSLEIGEWYEATGQAIKLKGMSNSYKLLPGAHLPGGIAVYEIPEPEPETENITLETFMARQSSSKGLKFAESNSGRRQKPTYLMFASGEGKQGPNAKAEIASSVTTTEQVLNAVDPNAWWRKRDASLVPCTSEFDNGCPNTRGIQEKTLKAVNVKPGDVILEVGFFLGEAMAKASETLAKGAVACDLIVPGRERIAAAKERAEQCSAALEQAKGEAAEKKALAAESAKAADERAAALAEEAKLRQAERDAQLEELTGLERLKAMAAEQEQEREQDPTLVKLKEAAYSTATASAEAATKCKEAAQALEQAYKVLDYECIVGGGVGRIHGCELEGRFDELADYLKHNLSGEAMDIAQIYRADVGKGIGSLPFPDQVFDKAYSIGALHFWPDLPAALAELRRVLDPQGILVLALQPQLIAAGQWQGCLPGGMPWNEHDIIQALREAGFDVETPQLAERFTLADDTNATDLQEAMMDEKEERLKLAQQQQRAAESRELKSVPDIKIDYIGAPCYRTVYCTCCRGFIGSGAPLYQPAGNHRPPIPEASYRLCFGPTSCECLLPMLDADYIDELQLDVAHPWSPDVIVTHAFGKQEFPPVDLENHPILPVLDYNFTTEQTETLMKTLSTNKRAMFVTVKAYAVELDYKGDITTRSLLGTGTIDLGVYLLNKATLSAPASDEGAEDGEQAAHYQMKVLIESATAKREPMARVTLDFRADARAWNAAYAWRLRRIYHPMHEMVNICRDCFRMAMTFKTQQEEITARWVKKHKQLRDRADETQRNKGALGIGLDYVIFTACPLKGPNSAARSLATVNRLSENFLTHTKDQTLAVPAEFFSPERIGGSKRWAPRIRASPP